MIKVNNTQDTRQHVVGAFPIKDNSFHDLIVASYRNLYAGFCEGAEMRDWITWPKEYFESAEYKRVKNTAKKIQENSEVVIVVGIGGSYLTPQAIIHSEYGEFYNEVAASKGLPKIYFAGCDLSPDKLKATMEMIGNKHWSIIYISKSGGTMEPAMAFRNLWNLLQEEYQEEANDRVYAITDAKKGILKGLADEHGWESFVIPDGIGGRFSGLTAVGLLPIAVAGIDTDALLRGAIDAMEDCKNNVENFAVKYAEWRFHNYFGEDGLVEFLAMNTPYLSFYAEWMKQLFGESEGKDKKGIFPTSGVFPTDLHSLGQYLQEGTRYLIFETFIKRKFKGDVEISESDLNDNLDDYAGKKFSQAASAAMHGAYNAHTAGGNPCAMIEIDSTLEAMGAFMYYCFVVTAVTAIAMSVNPFNQPGVEFHKQEMKKSPEWDK
ncbi:MAG: glucose-6-phosphate isomerase [Clostridia bacterium]|nr:glucose-6-phosphate isomerase [Clostridia bacterium]